MTSEKHTNLNNNLDIENDQEKDQGHVDTRTQNFECDRPDPNLGCDLGVDVAG